MIAGAEGIKSLLLQGINERVEKISAEGCTKGKVQDETIKNMKENMESVQECVSEIGKKFDKINDKMFYGLLAMILIALAAGINLAQIFHLIPKP
jgi:hypothetical protein